MRIQGPPSVLRDGGGPVFTVDADDALYVAIEVATDRSLLPATGRPGGHVPGFHGTWMDGPLTGDRTLRLPGPAWASLRTAPRLWYRALASERPDAWVGTAVTVPDDRVDQVPDLAVVDVGRRQGEAGTERVDEVWAAAVGEEQFASLTREPGASGAVVRHATSPRRPRQARDLLWVVCAGAPLAGGWHEAVVLLREPDLTVEYSRRFPAAAGGSGSRWVLPGAAEVQQLSAAVRDKPDLLQEVGPVWVWQDLAPPPERTGGTLVVSARSGRELFAATTSWEGAAR